MGRGGGVHVWLCGDMLCAWGGAKSEQLCFHWQVFGSKVRVDSTAKVAELELAEKVRFKKRTISE